MQKCFFPARVKDDNIFVWCPKLMLAGDEVNVPFENTISLDGETIFESSKTNNDEFVEDVFKGNNAEQIRYVFPYYKTPSGNYAYVYKGIFTLDKSKSKEQKKRVWIKTADSKIDLTLFK